MKKKANDSLPPVLPSVLEDMVSFTIYAMVLSLPMFFLRITKSSFLTPKELLFSSFSLILIFLAAVYFLTGRQKYVRTELTVPVLFLVLFSLVSIFRAKDVYTALIAFSRFMYAIGLFYVCLNFVRDLKQMFRIGFIIALTGIIASLWGILEYFDLRLLLWSESEGRLGIISTFGNPNYFAGYLNSIFPLCLTLAFLSRKWEYKLYYQASSVIILAGIIVSRTRGSWLGILAAIIFMCLVVRKYANWRLILRKNWHGVASVLGGVILILGYFLFSGRIGDITSRFTQFHNVTQRFLVWRSTMEMVKDYPLFGVGLGNFKVLYLDYQGKFLEKPEHADYIKYNGKAVQAHNEYLQVWAETGTLGLGVVIWIIVVFFFIFFRPLPYLDEDSRLLNIGLAGNVVAVLVHAIPSFNLHLPASSTVFCISTAWIAGYGKQKTEFPFSLGWVSRYLRPVAMVAVAVLVLLLLYHNVILLISNYYWKKGLFGLAATRHYQDKPESRQLQLYHFQQSLDAYKRALELEPRNGAIRCGMADVMVRYAELLDKSSQRKMLEAAVREYKRAMKNYHKRELFNDLGNAYVKLGDFEEAEKVYRKGVFIDPTFTLIRNNLANLYIKTGRTDLACQEFEKLLQIDDSRAQATVMRNLAIIYQRQGNLTGAVSAYERLKNVYPDDYQVSIVLGRLCKKAGELTRAAEALADAIEILQRDTSTDEKRKENILRNLYHETGLLYGEIGNYEGAEECFRTILADNPDDPGVLGNLGVALGYKGDYDGSIEVLKKVLELKPDSLTALINISIAYMRLYDFGNARRYLNRIIQTAPESAEAKRAKKMLAEIEEVLKQKIRVKP